MPRPFSDNIPILYLAGGPALGQYAVRPNFSPVRSYQSVTKHAEVITAPGQVAGAMRRAFHNLRNGRPGPVIVEIPADVGGQEVPESALTYQSPKRLLQSPERGAVAEAAKLLLNARKPVIWSGMGVLFSSATEELRELAELTQIPVYTTMPGKSSFDERHPLSLGAGSAATSLPARKWVQESDVLFAVGSSMTRTSYGQPIPDGKVIIHNVESIEDINKDFYVDVGLPGDAKLTLQALVDEVKAQVGEAGRQPNGVAEEIAEVRRGWMAEWLPLLETDEVPIGTYRVINEIDRNLDKDNSTITHDAGAPRDTILPFYTATTPHSYIGWGKSTHLGYGIPLMIGAKLADPNRFCLNFMGDGAFGMSGLDIETSVRAGAPITTVVLNNGGMATYPGGYPVANELFGLDANGRRLCHDRGGNGRSGHYSDPAVGDRTGPRPGAAVEPRRTHSAAGHSHEPGGPEVHLLASPGLCKSVCRNPESPVQEIRNDDTRNATGCHRPGASHRNRRIQPRREHRVLPWPVRLQARQDHRAGGHRRSRLLRPGRGDQP